VFAALAVVWVGGRALASAVLALATSLAIASLMHRRLDGLTGDVYGAAVELAELAVLASA